MPPQATPHQPAMLFFLSNSKPLRWVLNWYTGLFYVMRVGREAYFLTTVALSSGFSGGEPFHDKQPDDQADRENAASTKAHAQIVS